MPVVIAVILAATLAPAAAALERRGVSRTMAAMAVTVGTGVTIIGVLVVTVASLIGPLAELVSTATTGAESSGAQTVGIGSFVAAIGGGLQATVAGALADFVGIMVVLALGGFLTFYFIRDGGRVWQGLTRVRAERSSRSARCGGFPGRRRARWLHARDRGDLPRRCREPVGHHGHPGTSIRPAPDRARPLRAASSHTSAGSSRPAWRSSSPSPSATPRRS